MKKQITPTHNHTRVGEEYKREKHRYTNRWNWRKSGHCT